MLKTKLLAALQGSIAPPKLYVDDVFSTYTYTGNGATQTINNGIDLAGKGGLVWTKSRSGTNYHSLIDTDRGAYRLVSNLTDAQYPLGSTERLVFNSNGYSLGAPQSYNETNGSGISYASWTFRKAPKFFDLVTYTGNGVSGRAIPHSLGIKPGMMIVKKTNAAKEWYVWHRSLINEAQSYLILNSTDRDTTYPLWITPPDSNNFYVGMTDDVNSVGSSYVAYLFAHDPSDDGIIQCGTFTTDSSGNATVNLGWEPQYLLVKCSSSVMDWYILDQSRAWDLNANDKILRPNVPNTELTATIGNPTADGFFTGAGANLTFVYMAIRRPNKPPSLGTDVYNGVLRSGTSVVTVVNTVGFAPDLVITKNKQLGYYWSLTDKVRGSTYQLEIGFNVERSDAPTAISSFNPSGVTFGPDAVGYINNAGATLQYMNYFFKRARGVFDIVSYTGTGIAKSEAHNLAVIPELIIVKNRTQAMLWGVYSAPTNNMNYMVLQAVNIPSNSNNLWDNTTPSEFVFHIGSSIFSNYANDRYVAYLFATKAGISKVGSYIGNGASQIISCGFTTGARFILIKRTDVTGDWYVWDTVRGIVDSTDPHLSLNVTSTEVTTDDSVDPDSSGFIVNQNTVTNINVSGATYIFLSFA